jgi:hypothetical protein
MVTIVLDRVFVIVFEANLVRDLMPIGGWVFHASGVRMPCKWCGSVNQNKFRAEVAIHFPGLKNIDKPVVWVFPEVVICLDCGTSEFAVPEAELQQLAKGDAAVAG